MIAATPENVLALAKQLTPVEQDILRARVLPEEGWIELGKRLGMNGPKAKEKCARAYRLIGLGLGADPATGEAYPEEAIADLLRAAWMREAAGLASAPRDPSTTATL